PQRTPDTGGQIAPAQPPSASSQPSQPSVQFQQETRGSQSPAISGVGGNVTIEQQAPPPNRSGPPPATTKEGAKPPAEQSKAGNAPAREPSLSPQVHQETHGAQSPAVSNVQGNVTIDQGGSAQKK